MVIILRIICIRLVIQSIKRLWQAIFSSIVIINARGFNELILSVIYLYNNFMILLNRTNLLDIRIFINKIFHFSITIRTLLLTLS